MDVLLFKSTPTTHVGMHPRMARPCRYAWNVDVCCRQRDDLVPCSASLAIFECVHVSHLFLLRSLCQEHNKADEELSKADLEECTFRPAITAWPGMEGVSQVPVRASCRLFV